MKSNRFVRTAVFAFFIVITAAFTWYYAAPTALAPTIEEKAPSISVSLSIADVLPSSSYQVPPDTTALGLLVEKTSEHEIPVETKEYTGMGVLVEKIGAVANGTEGKYWHYYINGKLAPVGADAYKLQEGDSTEWRFHEPSDSYE